MKKIPVVTSLTLYCITSLLCLMSLSHAMEIPINVKLNNAWRVFEKMSDDPDSTRTQWLRLVRRLKRITKESREPSIRAKSQRLTGRAYLALYHRSGRSEDLGLAIREYQKLNASGKVKRTRVKNGKAFSICTKRGSQKKVVRKPPTSPKNLVRPVSHIKGPLGRDFKANPTGICAPAGGKCSGAMGAALKKPARVFSSTSKKPKDRILIVIDPGHGGKDPGAVSSGGMMSEKGITLKIAKRVKKFIEKFNPNARIILTRTGDSTLSLGKRPAIANRMKADLFISIHCNSSIEKSSQGFETYYLSPARTDKAMEIAALENGMSIESLSDLQATLLELTVCSNSSESRRLANCINKNIQKAINCPEGARLNRGAKPGPFYALMGATMPAALVECGFLSNMEEAKRLRQSGYLNKVSMGIARAATEFFRQKAKGGLIAGNTRGITRCKAR